jgi:hypothetical protein
LVLRHTKGVSGSRLAEMSGPNSTHGILVLYQTLIVTADSD